MGVYNNKMEAKKTLTSLEISGSCAMADFFLVNLIYFPPVLLNA
jgi:hypothetical protein